VPTPRVVRGLYVNRWAALGQRMWELIDVAKRTEVNALVIDVKDDRGFTLYRSTVPLAREIGADTTRPMSYRRVRAVLDTMRTHGIYPIARIVFRRTRSWLSESSSGRSSAGPIQRSHGSTRTESRGWTRTNVACGNTPPISPKRL